MVLWETTSQKTLHHLGYVHSPMINYNFTDVYSINIFKYISAQYDIGWDNALRGCLTPLWGHIQYRYYSKRYPDTDLPKIFTVNAFKVHLSHNMWHIFYGIWNQRNSILHDHDVGTKVQHMDQRLRHIYSYHNFYVRNSDQYLFQAYSIDKAL